MRQHQVAKHHMGAERATTKRAMREHLAISQSLQALILESPPFKTRMTHRQIKWVSVPAEKHGSKLTVTNGRSAAHESLWNSSL